MFTVRKAHERGHAEHGWLESYHSFSFADYHDPAHMGFRALRVINEDRVQPGRGFGTHGHRDMEIISYVLSGALQHKDSMGSGSVIRPGDVQLMSAGNGVTHSEFNASAQELVHFLQIWIVPNRQGFKPNYQEKNYPLSERSNRLCLVASPTGEGGSLVIQQDMRLYASVFDTEQQLEHNLETDRHAWVQVARGELSVNGERLQAGDGIALSGEKAVSLHALSPCECLLFDLP